MNVTPLPPDAPRARSMRGRGVRFVCALLTLLVLPACATKGDIAELTAAVDGLRAQSARTDSVLGELARDIDRLQDTVRTAQGQQIDTRGSMARDLRQINDQLSRIEQLVGLIQSEMSRLEDRVVRRVGSVEQLPTSERPDTLRGQRLRDPGNQPQTTRGGDPDAIFDVALRQYRNQALVTARTGFSQFLNMAPPNHPRAAEAWFYLGDIQEQQENLEAALDAFLRVHELFPGSDQVPMALYRAGALEHERGNDEQAREHLRRLVNSFPESDAAGLARELLEEIG